MELNLLHINLYMTKLLKWLTKYILHMQNAQVSGKVLLVGKVRFKQQMTRHTGLVQMSSSFVHWVLSYSDCRTSGSHVTLLQTGQAR